MIEWESTIQIPITESKYDLQKNTSGRSDVIFLFENGARLSQRTMQEKTTLTTRNLMGFYKEQCFPITRTTAVEKTINIPPMLKVSRAIHRIITFNDECNGLRVSYNKEECDDGVKYNIEFEIEYAANSTYNDIIKAERKLMALVYQNEFIPVKTIMSLGDIFSYVMSKVQMWHCFDPNQPYQWAYKWNGIKAKMIVMDHIKGQHNLAYLCPDANPISTQTCRGENLSIVYNMCLLVEIMDDRVVIIEVIGSSYGTERYTTEPITNIKLLKYLHANLKNAYVGDKPLCVQKFYDTPLPKTYDDTIYDGFIIVQNNLIIKWKLPTVDVKCVAPYTYTVAANNTIYLPHHKGCVGSIYELSNNNVILRERTDRIASSSEHEYALFLESVKLLNEA